MKIAMVALQASSLSQVPDSDPGHQAYRVSALARALAELDHQVTVYARRDSAEPPARSALAPGVTVELVPAGPAEPLPAAKLAKHVPAFGDYLARRWHRDAPDVAHAHFWTSGLAALAGARDLRVPIVQTFHSLQATHPDGADYGAARLRLEPVIARSVTAILASSSAEMSTLARLGVARTSVRLVPNGVDTETFLPEGPAAERNGRHRLLCVAPLTDDQGLDTIVRALADVPDAELVIAGGPPPARLRSDRVYRRLVPLARELRVRDRLVFLGQVSESDLPALFRSADLLVDAATEEPFCTVTLAAMACGTPVVASAVGSHQDTVVDGTTGILVPPGRPQLMAHRIRRLLASPMLLEGYGIAAADRAKARYSWPRIGQETAAIYQRTAGAGSAERGRAAA